MTRFQKARAYIYYFFVLLGVAFKDMFYKPEWKRQEILNKKFAKKLQKQEIKTKNKRFKEIAKSVRKEF